MDRVYRMSTLSASMAQKDVDVESKPMENDGFHRKFLFILIVKHIELVVQSLSKPEIRQEVRMLCYSDINTFTFITTPFLLYNIHYRLTQCILETIYTVTRMLIISNQL